MKDLLNFIVTSLVTKPDAVKIEENNQEGNVDLNLTVDPSDMGLIIGKNGQTIRAIRKLLTVRAIAENVRVNLQLAEPGGQNPEVSS
ncbi:KH domain-containing protein [Candidatus Daviesbacteria bacterium]|nr:KH domain-containing protein [Candidatus Daviesbacteria bacterium]